MADAARAGACPCAAQTGGAVTAGVGIATFKSPCRCPGGRVALRLRAIPGAAGAKPPGAGTPRLGGGDLRGHHPAFGS
jgi:hypothetical protein